MKLQISDTTFRPSTVSSLMASQLSIGEGEVAIDVGCGSGVLAIIAAKLGARHVHAIDKSPDVLEVGRANAEANDVADRITFYQGDLFDPLADDIRADVIIGDVSGIPDTLADESGWFPTKGGGGTREASFPSGCWRRPGAASAPEAASSYRRVPSRTRPPSSRSPVACTPG